MKKILQTLFIGIVMFTSVSNTIAQQHSVAREWNEVMLNAIRNDLARPTVHARNLWHASIAMYDIWAIYDGNSETFLLGKTVDGFTCNFTGIPTPDPAQIEALKEEAISYAVYRLIRQRFAYAPGVNVIITEANNQLVGRGYSPGVTSTNYTTGSAAALGNYVAECIINFGMQDGANQGAANNYLNQYYQPVNPPLITDNPGNPDIINPNRWQPLTLDVFIDQSGNPIPFNTPPFLSPEWGNVTPFALSSNDLTIRQRNGNDYWVYHDPGPPPYLDTTQITLFSREYQWNFALTTKWSSHLDPTDGVNWDISPASIGNIQDYPTTIWQLKNFYDAENGGDTSIGHTTNPHTGQPYTPQMVPRGDYTRVLAEFWADGPDSETPPGHWFTILNYVNDHPDFEKKFRGTIDVQNDLEWDVKAYFAMGGAMHDAAITAWGAKGWYDYIRPMSAIRCLADNGQSTSPSMPNYHPGGIPLTNGFIEQIQAGDPLAGVNNINVGKIKVRAWRGSTYIGNPAIDQAGVDWILAERWWPYQRPSFVTPPFAGYVSGHSTYSRAAAELLTLLTGDEFFPGGMGEFPIQRNDFLVFEEGPSQSFTLQWATYRDASDQCSLSRIWGGIHPPADDMPGRLMGEKIGVDAFHLAEKLFYRDQDSDGYFEYEDCDDLNADVYPGASEICDGFDNDCNGMADDGLPRNTFYFDNDNDNFGNPAISIDTCLTTPPMGYVADNTDCDDSKFTVNASVVEICNGIDDNCDGMIDEGLTVTSYYIDLDGDGFGSAMNTGTVQLDTCLILAPEGYAPNNYDCNDNDPNIHPDAPEVCDGIDNNCSGSINDGIARFVYYFDNDNDGFGDFSVALDTCTTSPPDDFVNNELDCNDEDANINPNASEICDALDNDCNGRADDGLPKNRYYLDSDGDSYGDLNASVDTCMTTPPFGYVLDNTDCDDSRSTSYPNATETPDNNIDEDCSGRDLYEQTKIFPNPANADILIHHNFQGVASVQVFTAMGQLVRNFNLAFLYNEATFNVSTLPNGVYFLRFYDLETGDKLFVEKLMIYK